MKELWLRISTQWTIIRGFYLLAGLFIASQAIIEGQWFGAIFGIYFTSMGLFAFGCASGACFGGACEKPTVNKTD
jgi:hypothetical protein